MNRATFFARFPEFAAISEELVTAILDEAELELTTAGDWGDLRDTAHGYLTADKLWNSPHGSTMRLDGGDKEEGSRYLKEFRRVQRKAFPAFLVT